MLCALFVWYWCTLQHVMYGYVFFSFLYDRVLLLSFFKKIKVVPANGATKGHWYVYGFISFRNRETRPVQLQMGQILYW